MPEESNSSRITHFAALEGHLHSKYRTQSHQWAQCRWVTGKQAQATALSQHCDQQNTFHPGKGFLDALPGTSSEREI
jgi:hypothetical protein